MPGEVVRAIMALLDGPLDLAQVSLGVAARTPDRCAYGDGCDHCKVTLEHALLPVRPGHEDDFEAAFRQAKKIIARMPGFRGLKLSRCLERPSTYLLLVEWDSLEDHTVGFRGSQDYQQWRQLLHQFYEPFPTVAHYEQVLTA